MSASFRIALAGEPLLALAKSAGPCHPAGCATLLNLLITGEILGEKLRHELGRLELSVLGFGILTQLASADPDETLGTGDIATALDCKPQTVSIALARLELSNFIRRSRDPANRRQNLVQLTERGDTVIRTALRHFECTIHRLMAVLTDHELEVLQSACTRLCPQTTLFST